ncbi:MAG TPA: alpha/beta hydrolase [Desulfobacteraceae bacterium]|nr:alpha/beta hydrolase [Desulfobacteraceae bacterium]HPJ66884.1 alpha/beta hydrolase [Desulfobacteraceae bacterium]HPQ27657.1 alpha/beta hydrolase [Desulfobacteraceae bacterium]
MEIPFPGYREAGRGPSVVCIHGSASSSGQWRPLMKILSDRFRIIAPDLYGHGRTPPWGNHRGMYVDDEVDLLETAFRMAGDRFHLIGHSWGGAIALKAALRHMSRLLSVVLYEPALWSLLVNHDPSGDAAREIVYNRDKTQRLMDKKDFAGAGEYFIDYWIGPGTWKNLSENRRSAFTDGMVAASPEWHASFIEATPLSAFASIDVPALLLTGKKSTAPARAMTTMLSHTLPNAKVAELEGIGHMGPVTHPEIINRVIEAFLMDSK